MERLILVLAEAVERLFISTAMALLINLASHFPAKEEIDGLLYRQTKLAEYQALDEETIRIITAGTQVAPQVLQQAIQKVIDTDFKDIDLPDRPVTRNHLAQMLTNLSLQAEDAYNIVNTTMRQSVMEGFVMGIEAAQAELNTAAVQAVGGASAQRASMAAVQRILDQGITGFQDSAGRNWTPEAYVNMVTRTTLHNTQVQGRFALMDDYGEDVFQVSSHLGARPLCAPYQGKFYSRNNTSGTVFDIDGNAYPFEPLQNTSYGEPAGLFGINCGHFPIPFFNGLSRSHAEPIRTAEQEKANKEQYERFQEMRSQERDIRAVKTSESAFRASGNLKAAAAQKEKAAAMMEEYKSWCEEHGMTPRPQRTAVGERRAHELQS